MIASRSIKRGVNVWFKATGDQARLVFKPSFSNLSTRQLYVFAQSPWMGSEYRNPSTIQLTTQFFLIKRSFFGLASELKKPASQVEDMANIPNSTESSESSELTSTSKQFNRFWKSVSLGTTSDGFVLLLDGRILKTPDGNQVVIPLSRPAFAALTAAEWEGQDKVLKSHSLPLTSIIVRAVDTFKDDSIRQGVIDTMLKYVHTDSICYQQSYPSSLVELQKCYWNPLVDWLKEAHNIDIVTTEGIISVTQSDAVMDKLREIIQGYDNIKLAAFEKAVMRSKSFIIGLALMEGEISVEFATTAGRLEVIHQIEKWGEVEDSHDTDREDLARQLGACTCAILE
ncbi:hypothetical protein BDV3_006284 [Batrachochytrium dendrobatidis]